MSIHALLAESDVLEEDFPVDSVTISIHALLAESDVGDTPPCCGCMISIHALLAESDLLTLCRKRRSKAFLSTLYFVCACASNRISIHALLAESDRQNNRFQPPQ